MPAGVPYSDGMKSATARVRNFHLPLPAALYERLRRESRRLGRPATEVARDGIREFLDRRQRAALHLAIARYAAATGGTGADLDRDLESAGIDRLLETLDVEDGKGGP